MMRKAFSTLSSTGKKPSFLRSIKGEVVAYPKNAVNVYGERPIVAVGVEAVQMTDETNLSDILRNMAKVNYLILRDKLLSDYRGHWLVTSSNKSMLVVEHEAVAEAMGEQLFRSKTEDYYIGCLGSEVISQAPMGNMSLGGQNFEENWTSAVFMDCEVSFTNGESFSAQRMKFETGACMTGVPKNVTSEFTLQRGPDEFYVGPDGRHTQANTFKNVVIRVAGVPISTRIIECRDWIMGHNVYKNFVCTMDTEITPPVLMVPRANNKQKATSQD